MENLIGEALILYQNTLGLFNSTKYSNVDEEYAEIIEFSKEHFVKMNNLATSCNYLNMIGYTTESLILTRTIFEGLIDFIELFKGDGNKQNDRMIIESNINKYKKHQELCAYKKFVSEPNAEELLESDIESIKEKNIEYRTLFQGHDKWYCKTMANVIRELDERIEDDDQIKLLTNMYRVLCFYSHGNWGNSDKRIALTFYQGLYTQYIINFHKCLGQNYFVGEYNDLWHKVIKQEDGLVQFSK